MWTVRLRRELPHENVDLYPEMEYPCAAGQPMPGPFSRIMRCILCLPAGRRTRNGSIASYPDTLASHSKPDLTCRFKVANKLTYPINSGPITTRLQLPPIPITITLRIVPRSVESFGRFQYLYWAHLISLLPGRLGCDSRYRLRIELTSDIC